MKPFSPEEEASERLHAFTLAVYQALVPPNGPCVSVQGELVRANERLSSECLRNGMGNYYAEDDTYYGALARLVLDTLIANDGAVVSAEDVAWFSSVRGKLERDHAEGVRLGTLEGQEAELTAAETTELDALSDRDAVPWEAVVTRAERCIANWCLAHPRLVDRAGKPVTEKRLRSIVEVFEGKAPPVKCPLCGGRGFTQKDEHSWPKKCVCAVSGK